MGTKTQQKDSTEELGAGVRTNHHIIVPLGGTGTSTLPWKHLAKGTRDKHSGTRPQ